MILVTGRRTGKTTQAIKMASATQSILVVANPDMVVFTEHLARDLNCPVQIVGAEQYFKHYEGTKKRSRIVIDDLEMVLSKAFGADVIMATGNGMTGHFIQDDKKPNQSEFF